MTDTLGEALPREMTRVRLLAQTYAKIGPEGLFALTLMNASLDRAQTAMVEGDLAKMIVAFEELKGFTK